MENWNMMTLRLEQDTASTIQRTSARWHIRCSWAASTAGLYAREPKLISTATASTTYVVAATGHNET